MLSELIGSAKLYTSDYVLDEVVTFLNVRCGRDEALKAGRAIMSSELVELVFVSRPVVENTLERFARCAVPSVSFTDICSIAIMGDYQIPRSFTFDNHFASLGVDVLNT